MDAQLTHPRRDLLQPLHQGLDLLGPDREFLDERDGLVPAELERLAERSDDA